VALAIKCGKPSSNAIGSAHIAARNRVNVFTQAAIPFIFYCKAATQAIIYYSDWCYASESNATVCLG
jgi:hypothetical protein